MPSHALFWNQPRWLIFHSELEIIQECGSVLNVFDAGCAAISILERGV